MKRFAVIICFIVLTISAFAQNKFEKYVFVTGNAAFGNMKIENSDGYHNAVKTERPFNTYLGLKAGFGFFVAKNFRLELGVGVPYSKEISSKDGDKWLYDKVLGVSICPNMAYFVKLADRFYYTPTIGGNFVFGKEELDVSSYQTEKYDYRLTGVYMNPVSFQFRVSPKFALGLDVGQVYYRRIKISYQVSGAYAAANQWHFSFNDISVSALFYF